MKTSRKPIRETPSPQTIYNPTQAQRILAKLLGDKIEEIKLLEAPKRNLKEEQK